MGQARQNGLVTSEARRPRILERPQPAPEEVFLAWLMWLPADADRKAAATREIDRIDASDAKGEGPKKLRALFADLAGA